MSEINRGTNIQYLLEQTKDMPEIYNRISTWLWIEFGIKSAELSLLLTYYEKKHSAILPKERAEGGINNTEHAESAILPKERNFAQGATLKV